ncbi:hypothetical protein Sez_1413 [Streptococcus equi subsp. zooepidemicus MGCS10565]|uniref:Uncharacterized protein n=1 Tax=Streptococcus equi subsp. zooepidemicus (strain MGCS10565) TaxID=552526 RepID=B4U430_STREM|nr:hypothetical protein Sez_1413 [Streptococcus equi subsp. zooepidemicus MGCS10565]
MVCCFSYGLQAIFHKEKSKTPLKRESKGCCQELFVLSSKADQEHLTSFLSFK